MGFLEFLLPVTDSMLGTSPFPSNLTDSTITHVFLTFNWRMSLKPEKGFFGFTHLTSVHREFWFTSTGYLLKDCEGQVEKAQAISS